MKAYADVYHRTRNEFRTYPQRIQRTPACLQFYLYVGIRWLIRCSVTATLVNIRHLQKTMTAFVLYERGSPNHVDFHCRTLIT